MTLLHRYIFFAVIAISITACSTSPQDFRATATAMGKSNQIIVVAEEKIWNGPVGDTLRFYYESPYVILPQPEPLFDLRHFDPDNMRAKMVNLELRTYIILADLSDQDSWVTQMVIKDLGEEKVRRAKEDPAYSTTVGKDKWAKGQMLFYQFAYGQDRLIESIKKTFPVIQARINEFDKPQIDATTFQGSENMGLQAIAKEAFDADIHIPADYKMAIHKDNFLWMRKDDGKLTSNIIMRRIPYRDTAQFSKQGIIAIRDSIGKQYVGSSAEDSYMRINHEDLPLFIYKKTINGRYIVEARGIWELVNDFMGGAFISHLIHDPEKKELLFVDGFIYAPGEKKRDYMQHIEAILATVKY